MIIWLHIELDPEDLGPKRVHLTVSLLRYALVALVIAVSVRFV